MPAILALEGHGVEPHPHRGPGEGTPSLGTGVPLADGRLLAPIPQADSRERGLWMPGPGGGVPLTPPSTCYITGIKEGL